MSPTAVATETVTVAYTADEEAILRAARGDVQESIADDLVRASRDFTEGKEDAQLRIARHVERLDEVQDLFAQFFAGPPANLRVDRDGEIVLTPPMARQFYMSLFYDITGGGDELAHLKEPDFDLDAVTGEAEKIVAAAALVQKFSDALEGDTAYREAD